MFVFCSLCISLFRFSGFQQNAVSSVSSGEYTLNNCIFMHFTSSKLGSAISIINENANIYAKGIFCKNCSATDSGGAIYFISNSSSLFRICGIDCWCNIAGQLIYTCSYSSQEVNETTAVLCGYKDQASKGVIFFSDGKQIVKNVNSSHNTVMNYGAGFYFYRSTLIHMGFGLVYNVTGWNVIENFCSAGGVIHKTEFVNIVKTNASEGGAIRFNSNYSVNNCFFVDNIIKEWFIDTTLLVGNPLNKDENYLLFIEKCFFSQATVVTNYKKVKIFDDCVYESDMTTKLDFLQTFECVAENALPPMQTEIFSLRIEFDKIDKRSLLLISFLNLFW